MSKHRLIPELTIKQLRNFWLKIDKRGPDDCWPWLGGKNRAGYGRFGLPPAGVFLAHRITHYLAAGKQPGPLCVCHKCDNPMCVNPAHLFLGTQVENIQDMVAKGRARRPVLQGAHHGRAKLTEKQVLDIRASNVAAVTLATKYGVSDVLIFKVRARKLWKHI